MNRNNFRIFILIALGAVLGAGIRWVINDYLIVNIVGSLLIGFLVGLSRSEDLMLLFGIGMCGSMTTFSGWINKCFGLIYEGLFLKGLALILYMYLFGFIAVLLGFFLARRIKLLMLSRWR